MNFKKNLIKDALVDAHEIEKFAIESAKKAMEESFAPQIEQAVINSIKELEALNDIQDNVEETQIEEVVQETVQVEENVIAEENKSVENIIDNSNQVIEMNDNIQENQDDMNEMFEIQGLSEEDVAAPTAPVPAMAGEPASEPVGETDIMDKLNDLTSKIDSILSAVNPQGAGTGANGEVDIVDDDNPEAAGGVPPAPAAPSAPAPTDDTVVNEDDIMFELDEEDFSSLFEEKLINEDDLSEEELDKIEDISEIKIVDEDDESNDDNETVDEMTGKSFTVNKTAGNRQTHKEPSKQHNRFNESVKKNNAQNESKLDELLKENASLKESVKKYKNERKEVTDSFIQLRRQVNEMQVFNGKLAYANRLLTAGGITAEEKIRVVEAFDKAETVEEAKKLYNKLIAEMNASKAINSVTDKMKPTAKPSVIQPKPSTQSEAIFESEERKRMKLLAGVTKRENYNS